MKNLFQRNWHTAVRRADNNLLKAETSYMDTYREVSAHLLVDVNSFIIQEAWLEEQRALRGKAVRTSPVPPLIGSEAYFNSSFALKKTAILLDDPLKVSLFAETIKGIIQAETFLFTERGYTSEEEYDNKWEASYSGSCRYYSNLDRVSQSWFAYLGKTKREGNLFVRFKAQSLFACGNEQYLITGCLSDSFHEIHVNLNLNKNTVTDASTVFSRVPDLVCREAAALLHNLQGTNLLGLPKKHLAGILGKGQGCVHLIDLVNDCIQLLSIFSINNYQNRKH